MLVQSITLLSHRYAPNWVTRGLIAIDKNGADGSAFGEVGELSMKILTMLVLNTAF